MKELTDFDRGIWYCVQCLVYWDQCSLAKQLTKEANFTLDLQKKLQDEEGNSFQHQIENFWKLYF